MNNELNITGIKHGLVTGLSIAIIVVLSALASRELYMFVSPWVGTGLAIGLPIYFALQERKNLGGYLSYTTAFVYLGIVFFISAVLWEFADITVFGTIDPGIIDFMLEESMPAAEKALRMFSTDEALIEQQLADAEAQIRNKGNYFFLISNSWWFLVKALILGSLAALIVRKNKPDFEEVSE